MDLFPPRTICRAADDAGGVVEARNASVTKGSIKTGGNNKFAVAQPFQVGKDMHSFSHIV